MIERTFSQKQLEKKKQILDAAIRLFAQNGYSATKISDIAKEAMVSFGTVFTYYENKEALFEATVREPLRDFDSVFVKKEITGEPVIQQLESIVKEQILFMAEHRNYLQLIQQVLGQPAKFPELLNRLDQYFAEIIDTLLPLIVNGQAEGVFDQDDPEIMTASYISFLVGIRLTFTDEGLSDVWERLIPQALKLFGPRARTERQCINGN